MVERDVVWDHGENQYQDLHATIAIVLRRGWCHTV
jgi:hypothetical protein